MTSLLCWVGVDSRGPASLNIASDSRISWASERWDQGRKVFAGVATPNVFGYYGDVVFPALAIPTVLESIDRRILPLTDGARWAAPVTALLRSMWRDYPIRERRSVGILHGVRFGSGMASQFRLALHSYNGVTGNFIAGRRATASSGAAMIEWRNELFERVDGRTRKRLKGAAKHWRSP